MQLVVALAEFGAEEVTEAEASWESKRYMVGYTNKKRMERYNICDDTNADLP